MSFPFICTQYIVITMPSTLLNVQSHTSDSAVIQLMFTCLTMNQGACVRARAHAHTHAPRTLMKTLIPLMPVFSVLNTMPRIREEDNYAVF